MMLKPLEAVGKNGAPLPLITGGRLRIMAPCASRAPKRPSAIAGCMLDSSLLVTAKGELISLDKEDQRSASSSESRCVSDGVIVLMEEHKNICCSSFANFVRPEEFCCPSMER